MATTTSKRSATEADTSSRSVRRKTSEAPHFGSDIITIEVGTGIDQKIFTAHKMLLSAHSDFFRAATDKQWREGKEKKVPLHEESCEIFQIFQQFVYSGKIFSTKSGDRTGSDETGKFKDKEWWRLSKAWVLGDKLLSTSFKDAVLDAMIAKLWPSDQFPRTLQDWIYPRSMSKAPVRQLLVDIAVFEWNDRQFSTLSSDGPSDFFYDLAIALHSTTTEQRKGPAPYQGDCKCKYHEHGQNGTCYKDMFLS